MVDMATRDWNGHSTEKRRGPTPLDALELARRHWLAGERIDMGALARELGVSRATLYSWVGSKERLLGEVIWSFAEAGVRQARERPPRGPGPRTSSTSSTGSRA